MVEREPLRLVYVVWHDAHSDTQTWTPLADLNDEPCVVHTVGFLLAAQKSNHVVIAQSYYNDDDGGRDVDAVLCIPIGMVKAMVVLTPMSENTSGRGSR
jgi:hypothetical protein